tara:strand:- start:3219 stop:4640 length:1422 start_codon:yes stop_codon:yes gene_type:complete
MSQVNSIAYHQVDFLLPVHRFNIRFSYVTKKGLPFMREFVLRLVHIAPMMPAEVAAYFGLSKLELDEAVGDLVSKGDLQFTDSGHIDLTNKARGYFVGLGSTPQVSALLESGGAFAFELAGFNCVGRKRTHEKWKMGLKLEVPNETVASSEKLAKSKFQKDFYQIQEKGYWQHRSQGEKPERPSIYTMESVRKIGQEPLRLTSNFSIGQEGIPVEREDFDLLDDSSSVQDLVTDAVIRAQKPVNFTQIAKAMSELGDQNTKTLFNSHSVDISKVMLGQQSGQMDSGKWVPFLGPVYAKDNWKLIREYLDPKLSLIKNNKQEARDLVWIAPSDSFWGKSHRTSATYDSLVDAAVTKGKKPIRLYNPKLYVPVQDASDRLAIGSWKQDFSGNHTDVYGLVEGFMDGNVEVMLLPGHLAVICYHISRPESLPVSLPVGFITTDKAKVGVVRALVEGYVGGVVSFDNPRALGPLSKL